MYFLKASKFRTLCFGPVHIRFRTEVLLLDILDMDFLHTDSSALDVSHPNILNPDVFTRHGSHTDLPLSYISHLNVSDQHVLQLVISDPAILHRNIAYKDVSQLVIFARCLEPNSEPVLFQSFWLVHSYTRTFHKFQTRSFHPLKF